jgi:hypothetical protein
VLSNPNLTWGRCNQDRQHILNGSGEVEVPRTRGLRVAGTYRFQSGTPINLVNSNVDADRNGILLDNIPAGTYTGNGLDGTTVTNSGGYNGATGPHFVELDLRLGYRFRLGEKSVDINIDTCNITDAPNFANPSGDQRNPSFLIPTALVASGWPRQAQINVRISF